MKWLSLWLSIWNLLTFEGRRTYLFNGYVSLLYLYHSKHLNGSVESFICLMISFKFKLISTVEVGTKGQVPRQFIATQCIKKGFTNSIDHVLVLQKYESFETSKIAPTSNTKSTALFISELTSFIHTTNLKSSSFELNFNDVKLSLTIRKIPFENKK